MSYRYFNPVAVHFGAQSLNGLTAILNGRKAALVTFPEARELGLVARLQELLGDLLVHVEEGVQPNPDVQELGPMYDDFWDRHASCEAIIAVGGGSAIDTAKALMVGTDSGRFSELQAALVNAQGFTPPSVKSLIAVPTTAGTGSEVTPWATIWDRVGDRKLSLHLDETWAQAAVIDAELMLTLPASVTLQAGLDALSHALESIWNVNNNPVSDMFAISASRTILNTLPALMAAPQDLELRSTMALAALKAGLAFSNTKTALAHSISYEITLHHGTPHGIACSFTLPMILERVIGVDSDRDQVLAEIFDGQLDKAPERLKQFLHALGVATEFSAYGVSDQDCDDMIKRALAGARGKNFIATNVWGNT